MTTGSYYVYALKDPTSSPARAFYVGKGTGSRAHDHLIRPDKTRKYARIKEILDAGHEPLVDILIDGLSETDALRLEAELIAGFGTEETGGVLTNSVVPSGIVSGAKSRIVVPEGAVEQAQMGLTMLMRSVAKLIEVNPQGATNAEVASSLGLRSDYEGKQKDYLSYSLLGLLLREGRIFRDDRTKRHISTRFV